MYVALGDSAWVGVGESRHERGDVGLLDASLLQAGQQVPSRSAAVGERDHHAAFGVIDVVAVGDPLAGVGGVELDVHALHR